MQEQKRLDEERRKRKEAEAAKEARQKAEAAKHTQKENVSDDDSFVIPCGFIFHNDEFE